MQKEARRYTKPIESFRTGRFAKDFLKGHPLIDPLFAGDPGIVMVAYRRHILSTKRSHGSARGLVHYRDYVHAYLQAKMFYILLTKNTQSA